MELSVGASVVFLADGFAVPLRGRIVALDEDWATVELADAAVDEDGVLREPGPQSTFRVPRSVVIAGR